MAIPCSACGAEIQPKTAERTGGMCVPCSQGRRVACRVCGGPAFRTMRGVELGDICTRCMAEEEKQRPTSIREFVAAHGSGDCSLLIRLFEIDERLRRKALGGDAGLLLTDPPEPYDSEATPANTISFADIGGDDVHFSLVTIKGKVSDASAVVVTVPTAAESVWETNFIVGASLHEFLCLGCERGYDDLADLAHAWEETVEQYETPPDPDEVFDDDEERLRIFREELGLRPWPNVRERLTALEQQKRFILRFNRDWFRWLR